MEKSFYYIVNWDDASYLTQTLTALNIPYTLEQPGRTLLIEQGKLAIVFPDLHVRQYNTVKELFNGHGLRYPTDSDV